MIRLISSSAAIAATLALAACGGGGSSTSSTATSSKASTSDVVMDSAGMALYTPDQEASGKVACTGACTSFWKPASPSSVPKSDGKVGTITRPDGSKQATIGGKPVYTFVEDSKGKVKGDGFSDDFGGKHFVWHAVSAGGKASSSSSGGGSGSDSDSGNYGY
jgi:predicted lipoprotein with Yx(FWY)xxD motif